MTYRLWGTKNVFAIEIDNYNKENKKGKFRLWLNNESLGNFKNTFKLSYAINAIKALLKDRENLYETDLDKKSPIEIFKYCLLMDKIDGERSQEDYERFKRMHKLSPYFGDQLDSVTKIIYFKDGNYHFLWSMNNDYTNPKIDYLKNFKYTVIPFSVFEEIGTSFLFEMDSH